MASSAHRWPELTQGISTQFQRQHARLLSRHGMALRPARVLSYVLLQSEPVSVERIARALGISKSGASLAVKELEGLGEIERHWDVGSKRGLFTAAQNGTSSLMRFSEALMQLSDLLHSVSSITAAPATGRLRLRAKLMQRVQRAVKRDLARLCDER